MSSNNNIYENGGPTVENILKQINSSRYCNDHEILNSSSKYNGISGVPLGGPYIQQTTHHDCHTIKEPHPDCLTNKIITEEPPKNMKENMKEEMNSKNILCYVTFGLIILALVLFIYCKII